MTDIQALILTGWTLWIKQIQIQLSFSSLNTDGSFTMAVSNAFLSLLDMLYIWNLDIDQTLSIC